MSAVAAIPSLRADVAALYIDPSGPYPKLVAPELCFDAARDARTYAGPLPVVAHPPCGPWSSLRHLSKRPEDAELGRVAFAQVRRFGGVLEQPKGSGLFREFGQNPLPASDRHLGSHDGYGFSIEVEQVAWGHVARKRTWLYIVGVPFPIVIAGVRTGGTPTHWVSGFRSKPGAPKRYRANGCAVPPGIKVCSAEQRRRTPLAFAQWLLDLAAGARVSR